MLVGILSDSHDHLDLLRIGLERFRTEGVELVIHAGDFVAPFAAKALREWTGPLHVVYGNNDGERRGLKSLLPQVKDGPITVQCGDLTISLDHYPPTASRLPIAGADVIVYGHTHEAVNERRDGTLYLNPGECCGWVNGRATVALLDTERQQAEIVPLR